MKIIYNKHDYTVQLSRDGTCVVHRSIDIANGHMLHTHVGEKLPSQDWREVNLMGCPQEIRSEIIAAWKEAV